MSYTDLRNKILIALYQEQVMFGERDIVFLLNVAKKYGLSWQDGWLLTVQQDLFSEGLITGPGGARNDAMAGGKITGAGMRQIESQYGSKDGVGIILEPVKPDNVLLTEDERPILTEDGQFIELEINEIGDASTSVTIDSADWTGIAQRLESDPAVVQQISKHISEIDRLVERSGLTNTECQKAKAITESLRLLVASPEPEWKAIALLLTSPALTAVLNVSAVIQVILKLFGIG